jgi:hypothetical protein
MQVWRSTRIVSHAVGMCPARSISGPRATRRCNRYRPLESPSTSFGLFMMRRSIEPFQKVQRSGDLAGIGSLCRGELLIRLQPGTLKNTGESFELLRIGNWQQRRAGISARPSQHVHASFDLRLR